MAISEKSGKKKKVLHPKAGTVWLGDDSHVLFGAKGGVRSVSGI
jgi:hypothetical protein